MTEPEKKNPTETEPKATASKPKKKTAKRGKPGQKKSRKTRKARIYPAMTFEDSLKLAAAIHLHASGEKVNRLTLCKAMNVSPTSSSTMMLITSSAKYGITRGSYAAEHLELTELGKIASDPNAEANEQLSARFKLAIEGIKPFQVMYERYSGKKIPSFDVLRDALVDAGLDVDDPKECIDTFIVNVKFLGILQTIAGSETLMPLSAVVPATPSAQFPSGETQHKPFGTASTASKSSSKPKWSQTCFYISPIGDEGSENRKHSDLFLNSLVEPAIKPFNLEVIRADQIGEPGMITSQVLEHIFYSHLVIVDLSFHNPNVFYEMAIRHACKLPIVQISRKLDKLPFDVNQVRTVTIDTTDIYSLVPRLETYRAEISTHVRAALEGQSVSNPVTVFFPSVTMNIPKVP